MYKNVTQWFSTIIVVVASNCVLANNIPDFYQEPGVNPKRQYSVDLQGVEHIDPFTGILRLSYQDLVIPGNGGLDISINRIYHVSQQVSGVVGSVPYKNGRTTTGMGWDIHFGRIHYDGALFPNGCGETNQLTDQNPVLELPDGSRKVLFNKLAGSPSNEYITKDRWTATCVDIANGVYRDGGLLVTSPDGIKYTMNLLEPYRGLMSLSDTGNSAWHTTRIEDRHGNWVEIDYVDKGTTQYAILDQITSSDGRRVDFTYSNPTSNNALLTRITSNGQSWSYTYRSVPNDATGYYFLDRVTGPEGLVWNYDYYSTGDGLYSIRRITTPYGGTVDYTYQERVAHEGVVGGVRTTAIDTKRTAGTDVTPGTWSFTFRTASNNLDETTITTPNGREVYYHCGEVAAFTGSPGGCQTDIGKLLIKEIYDGTTRVQTEQYAWSSVKISDQHERYPTRGYSIAGVYSDQLVQKIINRNNTSFSTSYSDFDEFDNPGRIDETSDGVTRRTDYTYYTNTSKWIIKQIEDETLHDTIGQKRINRTFNTSGNLSREDRYGELTQFTYTTQGDISRVTDPRNKSVTYSNYKRGIPQTEAYPENVTIRRTVNNTGTVSSSTNGRGHTTSYQYDNLNRITAIIPPSGARTNVNYSWSSRYRTVTRGVFSQRSDFDAFGRTVRSSAEGLTVENEYDALGNKIFESYPDSSQGTRYDVDVLGRIKQLTHTADNSHVDYSYLSSNRVSVSNENNKTTYYRYQSYGSPDEKYLIGIYEPGNINTIIERTRRGDIRSIEQDGKTRTFTYDSRYLLDYIDHPEIGRVNVNYDGNGNMISRRTGSSATTYYVYDGLNRLETINYPGATPDASYTYDDNNNITRLIKGNTQWDYVYDRNNNLTDETLTIDGKSFALSYTYNSLDALMQTDFPNSQTVDYSPNDLGWPTRVGAFASAITYHPNGQISSFRLGNGLTQNISQDDRLFIEGISVPGVTNLSYTYDDVGNPLSINDSLNSSTNRSMSYDDINRLVTASGSWGTASISYNRRGDITSKRLGNNTLNYSYQSNTGLLTSTSGARVYDFDYDVYGNVIGNGVDNFDYDDASNLVNVTSKGQQYIYDGHDRRVAEVVNGQKNYYVYSKAGQLMYEADAYDVKQTNYIRLGSMLVAQQEICQDGDQDNDQIPDCTEVESGMNPQDPSDATGDVDNDGLTNLAEYQLGSSITDNDTDADLMPDGYEYQYGLDLLNDDSAMDLDGDGYTNLDEYQRESDPTDDYSIPAGEVRWDIDTGSVKGMAAQADGNLYLSFAGSDTDTGGLGDGPGIPIDGGGAAGSAIAQFVALAPDGTTRWTHDFADTTVYDLSKPVIGADGSIYVVFTQLSAETGRGPSTLYSLSTAGLINWSASLGDSAIAITPAISSNGTIFVGAGNRVSAYSRLGVSMWSSLVPNNVMDNFAIATDETLYITTDFANIDPAGNCSAVIHEQFIDGYTFVDLLDSNLFAISADGSLQWHSRMDAVSARTPAIGLDGSLYYVANVGQAGSSSTLDVIYAYSRYGNLLWKNNQLGNCSECGGKPAGGAVLMQDGTLIVHGNETHAINPDGTMKWTSSNDTWPGVTVGAAAIVTDGQGLLIGTNDNLVMLNADGVEQWVSSHSHITHMLPSPVGDQIYLVSSNQLKAVSSNGITLASTPWPMAGQSINGASSALSCAAIDNDSDGIPACVEEAIGMSDGDPSDAVLDADMDGLTMLQEYQQRTHRFLADSDFDGLDDGLEVALGFSPSDADMDDDKIPDGFEYNNGLNPGLSDAYTDADGDGFSNIEEFIAGKDPSDTLSQPLPGDKSWSYPRMSWESRTAIGHDGSLYYHTSCGLSALSPSGQLQWIYPTRGEDYESFSPMVGPDGTIYSSTVYTRTTSDLNYYFTAINPDGTQKWEKNMQVDVRHQAIGLNGTVYVVGKDVDHQSALFAIRPDGSLHWVYDLAQFPDMIELIVGSDGSIYLFTREGHTAFHYDGTVKWQQVGPTGFYGVAIAPNGNLYYTTGNTLNAMSSATGDVLWSYSDPKFVVLDALTISANGNIIVSGTYGNYQYKDIMRVSPNGQLVEMMGLDLYQPHIYLGMVSVNTDDLMFNTHTGLERIVIRSPSGTINEHVVIDEYVPNPGAPTPMVDHGRLYTVYNEKIHAYRTNASLSLGGWPNNNQQTSSLAAGLPPVDEAPNLMVVSPIEATVVVEGNSLNLNATAMDFPDGDLSNTINWSSNIDGNLGTGSNLSANLSPGTHSITVSVTDSTFNTTTLTRAVSVNPVWDVDGDNMVDEWEMATFGTLTELPEGDFNLDGVSNYQEYKNYVILTFGGDINEDGNTNIADIHLMQQYLLTGNPLSNQQILRGDFYPPNGDNEITMSDLLILQQRVLEAGN